MVLVNGIFIIKINYLPCGQKIILTGVDVYNKNKAIKLFEKSRIQCYDLQAD